MKKIIAISSLSLLMFLATNSAQAADLATISAGSTGTISDAGSSGTLKVNPSPGVKITYASTDATYVIMALNTTAQKADQNEYGIYSGYSGYYQHNTATADTFSVTTVGYADATTDLADPFAAWTAMGGGGAAAAGGS